MGGAASHPLVESAVSHVQQCLATCSSLSHHAWVHTNDVCSNSCMSVVWPERWRRAAEEADISYIPIGSGSSSSYAYPSSRAPVPYLSKPEDRALYRIDDDEEAAWSANGSPPNSHAINMHATAVPHYSYRPPEPQLHAAAVQPQPYADAAAAAAAAASAPLPPVPSSSSADTDGSDEKHQPISSGSESDPSASGSDVDESTALSDADDADAVIVTHNAQTHSPHKHKHKNKRDHGKHKQRQSGGKQIPHPLQPTK